MSLFLHCRERLVRLVKPALWLIFITGTVILGASMFHEEIATVIVDALGASSKHDALKFGGWHSAVFCWLSRPSSPMTDRGRWSSKRRPWQSPIRTPRSDNAKSV